MNRILILLALTALACSKEPAPTAPAAATTEPTAAVTPTPVNNTSAWPPLPTTGFIHGRPATSADLAAGHAVFVGSEHGVALDIDVPQYAEWTDPGVAGGKPQIRRVFVIQAEKINGTPMLGLVDVESGAINAAMLTEVRLHGTKPQ